MNSITDCLALEEKSGCIASAMEIIGNKWTALILRDLAGGGKGFCELEKSVGQINPRTLSKRLDNLEENGIIKKTANEGIHPTYSLTNKGSDLIPVIKQMAQWGIKYASAPKPSA
jgi:DNA-binding HxlR family transcriptional regulator